MIYELDGSKMCDRAGVHAHIKEILSLPEYYGNNLDALYDALTEMECGKIVIRNFNDMEEKLGRYADAVVKAFMDAAAHNPALEVCVE